MSEPDGSRTWLMSSAANSFASSGHAAGRFRIPVLPDGDGWANPVDLVALAADPSAIIAARRLGCSTEPMSRARAGNWAAGRRLLRDLGSRWSEQSGR